MDLSRRGFLKMVGLGTAGAVVSLKTPACLFGSDEVTPDGGILTPGVRADLGWHQVIYARPVVERVPPELQREEHRKYLQGGGMIGPNPLTGENRDARVVGKIQSSIPQRTVLGTHSAPRVDHRVIGRSQEMIIPSPWVEGMDPHAAFYKASLDMRARLAQQVQDIVEKLHPEFERPYAQVITTVHQPIHARPPGFSPGDSRFGEGDDIYSDAYQTDPFDEENRKGFDVVADYHLQVAFKSPGRETDLTGFETYSTTGEYPIDIPNNIEMALLMKLDREVVSDPGKATRRGFFRLWRP